MEPALQASIERQREHLTETLDILLASIAESCVDLWELPDQLDQRLQDLIQFIPGCKMLYAVDCKARQISSNVAQESVDLSVRGQDLSGRPYIQRMSEGQDFLLSHVYLGKEDRQPCLTAVQRVIKQDGEVVGCLAADCGLINLPVVQLADYAKVDWRQIKGDPAIRQNLFQQSRVTSSIDEHLDEVHHILADLFINRGMFHIKVHYSGSRATLWLYRDPHHYHLHVLDEIIDPSVCLAYPRVDYPENATVDHQTIRQVFDRYKSLRETDNTVYLRSASLNIISGMVGLTFSCDGSHYMSVVNFLEKGENFWFGYTEH